MKHVIDSGFLSMLEAWDLHIQKPMRGLFGGNRRSAFKGSSAEFADFREYAAGDDLRRIDWNLYARFEKLYLKLFVDERQLHHRIYLDTSASMDWGEPRKKSETALRLAAALGFLSVKALDRVSFFALRDDACIDLCRTVVGRDAFYRVAETLNDVPFGGECRMDRAVTSQENPGLEDGVSVIISDFFSDDEWKTAVDYLLGHRRQVALVQVLSRDEVEPGFGGKMLLLDAEAPEREDERNVRFEITRSTLKAYKEAVAYHQNELRRFCANRGVSFFSLCTDENPEEEFFRKGSEEGLVQ